MKAIVCTAYGPPDALELRDVERPTPADNEVLIRVHGTTVTPADCGLRQFRVQPWVWLPLRLVMGVTKPRISIFGMELAGVIEEVGKDVTKFRAGERVFGMPGMGLGCHAEYVRMSADATTASSTSRRSARSSTTGGCCAAAGSATSSEGTCVRYSRPCSSGDS